MIDNTINIMIGDTINIIIKWFNSNKVLLDKSFSKTEIWFLDNQADS